MGTLVVLVGGGGRTISVMYSGKFWSVSFRYYSYGILHIWGIDILPMDIILETTTEKNCIAIRLILSCQKVPKLNLLVQKQSLTSLGLHLLDLLDPLIHLIDLLGALSLLGLPR